EIRFAVDVVGDALGHRVDDAAGGASVFSRVDAGVDGELANRIGGGGIGLTRASAFFSEEGLIVIGAVDLNVVQQGADAAHADQSISIAVRNYAALRHVDVSRLQRWPSRPCRRPIRP